MSLYKSFRFRGLTALAIVTCLSSTFLFGQTSSRKGVVQYLESRDQDVQETKVEKSKKVRVKAEWGDSMIVFKSVIENDTDENLEIIGAQTFGNFYIVDLPKTVKAQSSEKMTLAWVPQEGALQNSGSVRLLTSSGEKEVQVEVQVNKGIVLSSRSLSWAKNSEAAAKTIDIEILRPGLEISEMAVDENAATAVLEKIDASQFRLVVTPKTTAQEKRFRITFKYNILPKNLPTSVWCAIGEQN